MRAPEERPTTSPTSTRWRPRALVPALLCAAAGAALSCQGSGPCPPTTAPVPEPLPPGLQPRYAMRSVAGSPLPAVLTDDGTRRVRLLADTLAFAIGADSARGTYTETVVLGVRVGAGEETASRTVSAAVAWSRVAAGQYSLAAFSGGGPAVAATAGTAPPAGGPGLPASQLGVVTRDGRTFAFDAR